MTESAHQARLKLFRAPAPWKGVWGEPFEDRSRYDGKRASSAIEVELQASDPLERGPGRTITAEIKCFFLGIQPPPL